MHGDALVRLSFALCGDRGKAEDAAQEALTRVYLRWSRLVDPLPYARRSVVNATRDSWRHRSCQQQREQVVAGYPAERPVLLGKAGRTVPHYCADGCGRTGRAPRVKGCAD